MNVHILQRVDIRPDGPRVVGDRHQVTLPADLLAAIGVSAKDSVWVSLNPDRPGTLVVLSEAVMAEIFAKGWTSI